MATTTLSSPNPEIEAILNSSGSKSFKGMKMQGYDFSGRDLKGADFRGASVPWCNFSKCNLRYANFEHANCFGANYDEADLHRANFKNADISMAIMTASDMFGVTITLECSSFKGVTLKDGWWYGFLFYALLMKPPSKEAEDKLIAMIGLNRYTILREQYARRRL
jgi:hypothetical protein